MAGGVWKDATEFMGTRQFTRFAPVMPRESAAELMSGWQRAVRTALFWARDKGEPAGGKRSRKSGATRKGVSTGKAKGQAKVGRKSARKSK
jgi:hypothetical protein